MIIAPVGDHYTVTFLGPASKGLSPEKEPGFIEVDVQAETGAVLQIRNHARVGRQDPRYAGLLPSSRAYQIALQNKTAIEFDERGETTIELKGEEYCVTFPLPPSVLTQSRRPSYAAQVWLRARTGAVTRLLLAS